MFDCDGSLNYRLFVQRNSSHHVNTAAMMWLDSFSLTLLEPIVYIKYLEYKRGTRIQNNYTLHWKRLKKSFDLESWIAICIYIYIYIYWTTHTCSQIISCHRKWMIPGSKIRAMFIGHSNTDTYFNKCRHTMDMLWEMFHRILPLYMKPIGFQSKAPVVFSVTTTVFIDFCLMKLCFPNILVKSNEYLNSTEQITRNWNVNLISILITTWDIIQWRSINLLRKKLMGRMSDHAGLINSYQLRISAACTNTGDTMKVCHPRAADQCPFVPRQS